MRACSQVKFSLTSFPCSCGKGKSVLVQKQACHFLNKDTCQGKISKLRNLFRGVDVQQGKLDKESLVPSGLILLLATWILLKTIIRCTILLLLQRKIVYRPHEQIKFVKEKLVKLNVLFIHTSKENLSRKTCQGKLARVEGALQFCEMWQSICVKVRLGVTMRWYRSETSLNNNRIIYIWKKEGLYHHKVTSSLTSFQGLDSKHTTVKWTIDHLLLNKGICSGSISWNRNIRW